MTTTLRLGARPRQCTDQQLERMDRGGVLCLVLAEAAVAVGNIGVNGIPYAV
jgi:hypothetical protein